MDNSDSQKHPVGQKLPNPWGLDDMHGDVWEWCQDWWADNLPGGIALDLQGPTGSSYRVIRGGNWNNRNDNARTCRSANRNNNNPENRNNNIGFRAVLAPAHPERWVTLRLTRPLSCPRMRCFGANSGDQGPV